jgi:hypothetical protein
MKKISEISVACFEWMAILHVPFGKERGGLKEGDKDFTKNRVDRRAFEVMVEFSDDWHQRSASGGSVLIVFGTSN